jgi:hypothetical protein
MKFNNVGSQRLVAVGVKIHFIAFYRPPCKNIE